MPILAPPARAVIISPVSDAVKPRTTQAMNKRKRAARMPRTAPALASSHGPLKAATPIIATGNVVSRLNAVADSPTSRCSTVNSGPMDARMGRRSSPTINAIKAKSKGDEAMRFTTGSL